MRSPGRAAATLLAGVLLLTACAGSRPDAGSGQDADSRRDAGEPRTPGWAELPTAPVSPRVGAIPAWTGTEALFLGGDDRPCPPLAACKKPESARDGAAFDPVNGTWRRTADAPRPVPSYSRSAVVGDVVYLLVDGEFLGYDASDDAWQVLPPVPDEAPELLGLGAGDGGVVAFRDERRDGDPPDQFYDPSDGTWTALPADPLGPAYNRRITGIPGGLVLTGKALVANPGADGPSLVRAAVLDLSSGEWTLLDDTEQIGGWRWAWTGSRLVDPSPGGGDGGEVNNWGRTHPIGGILDPVAGTWAPLPNPPESMGGWPVEALGGPASVVEGWVYDDRQETWTELPVPDGAPATPGSGIWAGDQLVVLGGVHSERGWTAEDLSDDAWIWTPPAEGSAAPAVVTHDDLRGSWVLVEGTADGEPIPIPARARGTLTFASGSRASGTAFCNAFGGEYELSGDTVSFVDVGQTLKLCHGEVGAAEKAFHDVLQGGSLHVTVDQERLVLTGDRGSLTFDRLPPVPTEALAGVRWVLESVVAGGTASPAVGDAVLELGKTTATVSTGCRDFEAQWRPAGDTIFLYGWQHEEVDCPTKVAAQDDAVVGVLAAGFQATVDGDVLTVSSADTRGSPAASLLYRAG